MISLQNLLSPSQPEKLDPYEATFAILRTASDPKATRARVDELKVAAEEANKVILDARAATSQLKQDRDALESEIAAQREKQATELYAERTAFDAEVKSGRDNIEYLKQQATEALVEASASRDKAVKVEADLERRLDLLKQATA